MSEEFHWVEAEPASRRLSGERLRAMCRDLAGRGTRVLLVVREDGIVHEWYADGFGLARRHYSASLAKSLVGGLSLMLALDDGFLALDEAACRYIPEWRADPLKSRIAVCHLATHCSGLEDAELSAAERRHASAAGRDLTAHHMSLPGWKGAFWRREPDPFTVARDHAPVIFEPGSAYAYSNTGMAMLAYAVTAALRDAPQKDIRSLLRERIMQPVGVDGTEWSVGYGRTYEVDGLPLVANWGGGEFTARAAARLGRLMLHGGEWQGRRLLSQAVVEMATRYAGTPLADRPGGEPVPASGICWWTNYDGVWPALPLDTFGGFGAGNQALLVAPTLDMLVVRFGEQIEEGSFYGGLDRHLFRPLAAAVLPPVPPSPLIERIDWAAAPEITRRCLMRGRDGNDNWPVAWADDGDLYTAYDDGWGFEPGTAQKLSMGVAKVSGDPPRHVGHNIPSDAEFDGMGRTGPKAGGMLMVGGVLYMWLRNANRNGAHCRLGWSKDHGHTWQWAHWAFEELGYCTFLNFGRDYAGTRDEYVYTYSHDNPSAYVAADRMVLAQAPRAALEERAAWEFFSGFDAEGGPRWSRHIEERGAVLTNPRRCLRSGASYDAGIGRYLWWHQMVNHPTDSRTRFQGGFAVYDAPEPWGPWTCAFYTELWDVGPGKTGSFPPKWMSEDGRTVHLVFSGDDAFSVRRARIVLRREALEERNG